MMKNDKIICNECYECMFKDPSYYVLSFQRCPYILKILKENEELKEKLKQYEKQETIL